MSEVAGQGARDGGALARHKADEHRITPLQDYIRQIVYGGNDGIVTTFAVVAGFAGLAAEGTAEVGVLAVLLFGLANLFADATAMGLGEFLSARSEQDVYRAIRERERGRSRRTPRPRSPRRWRSWRAAASAHPTPGTWPRSSRATPR